MECAALTATAATLRIHLEGECELRSQRTCPNDREPRCPTSAKNDVAAGSGALPVGPRPLLAKHTRGHGDDAPHVSERKRRVSCRAQPCWRRKWHCASISKPSRRSAAPCPRAAPYRRITFSSGSARTTCPRAFGCPVSLASTVH